MQIQLQRKYSQLSTAALLTADAATHQDVNGQEENLGDAPLAPWQIPVQGPQETAGEGTAFRRGRCYTHKWDQTLHLQWKRLHFALLVVTNKNLVCTNKNLTEKYLPEGQPSDFCWEPDSSCKKDLLHGQESKDLHLQNIIYLKASFCNKHPVIFSSSLQCARYASQ